MIRHTRLQVIPLTQALAAAFADMPAQAGERPLKAARLNLLRQRIEEGTFYPPRWSRAHILSTGKTIRVNGQHSSTLLKDHPDLLTRVPSVAIDDFECDTEHDAATLFMQFDDAASARTVGDILNAHARTHPEIGDVPSRIIRQAMGGVKLAQKLARGHKLPSHEQGELVHLAIPFIRFCAPFIAGTHLNRANALAAMSLTYDANPEKSAEFWKLVADESHPDNAHPTRHVARLLFDNRSAVAAKVRASERAKKGLDDRAVVAKCIYAWNAFITDRPLQQLRYAKKDEFPQVNHAANGAPELQPA